MFGPFSCGYVNHLTFFYDPKISHFSNASDALDKLRFLSVTAPELMEGAPELDIRIQTDQENGIITLTYDISCYQILLVNFLKTC